MSKSGVSAAPVTTHKGACKFCGTSCAIELDVADGRVVAVRGDREDPLYGGYTCLKGRALPEALNHPDRLLASKKRRPDGGFDDIGTMDAVTEIANRLRAIIARHGPRAVALYVGTYGFLNSPLVSLAGPFQAALGSPHFYTPLTIDQPAKMLCAPRMGLWGGGFQGFADAEVVLILGNNVMVSHYTAPGGISGISPSRSLREAQARGMRVIVADPRRTETAARADLFLQVRPGEDAPLIAGLLQVIFAEGLYDAAFCAEHVGGLDALKAAVADFTPDYVARRADIPMEQVTQAARMFAGARRGIAVTGTGPEMSGCGLVVEYLVTALNIVCGRVVRAGERPVRQSILSPMPLPRAEVLPPAKSWGEGCATSRIRELTTVGGQMPCSVLADEILTPGEGQVRALIVIGGNPVVAFPDQDKIVRALDSLDLLVSVDNRLSQTARRADYVIAPSMSAERDDTSLVTEMFGFYDTRPYGFYVSAAVPPPGDTIDEWELIWELARRLDLNIVLPGGTLPLDRKISKFELFELISAGSPLSVGALRERTRNGAHVFEELAITVAPASGVDRVRFDLTPDDFLDRLRGIRDQALDDRGRPVTVGDPDAYPHLYVCRRVKHFLNSVGHNLTALCERGATNYAHIHPDDLAALGIADGDAVEISAAKGGELFGIAIASPDVKRGVVSMSHAFGDVDTGLPGLREHGNSTNRLASDVDVDPITGMPRQSAIPVRLRAVSAEWRMEI